jgi:hypothetical protein
MACDNGVGTMDLLVGGIQLSEKFISIASDRIKQFLSVGLDFIMQFLHIDFQKCIGILRVSPLGSGSPAFLMASVSTDWYVFRV